MSEITEKALEIAIVEVGVREDPLGSNRGPRVDEYVKSVGLDPYGHYSWCAAFVYWCFQQAANELWTYGKTGFAGNPCPRTGSAMGMWHLARPEWQSRTPVKGSIFVISLGHGTGHVGLVSEVDGEEIVTIEGNTNTDGSSNGIGVFLRRRHIEKINTGFINIS